VRYTEHEIVVKTPKLKVSFFTISYQTN